MIAAPQVSLVRLHLLRAAYLILTLGLIFYAWPDIVRNASLPLWQGLMESVFGALSILALLGLRYPLKMLPLLFFELTWKTIWLLSVALPLWMTHAPLDPAVGEKIQACVFAVVLVPLIPWHYAWVTYVRQAGDRWT